MDALMFTDENGELVIPPPKVLSDMLHIMRRWCETLTRRHAKAAAFMAALSEAFFERDAGDEQAMRAAAAARSTSSNASSASSSSSGGVGRGGSRLTTEELQQRGAGFWNRRCRRHLRAPSVMIDRLRQLVQRFSGDEGRDPQTGEMLLTQDTKSVLDATIELINHGSICGEFWQACRAGCMHFPRVCSLSLTCRDGVQVIINVFANTLPPDATAGACSHIDHLVNPVFISPE